MMTVRHLVDFLFQQLPQDKQAVLAVTNDYEILNYTKKFKDIWQLSDRVLGSHNELSSLKEAMKRMDRPQFFYDRVLHTYQNNLPVSNVDLFRTGETVKVHYHPFNISRIESIRIWVCESNEIVDQDKINGLHSLTASEKKALYYYLFGYTVPAVAAKLEKAESTAITQVQGVKDKWGCRTRDELIDLVRTWGLIHVLLPEPTENISIKASNKKMNHPSSV